MVFDILSVSLKSKFKYLKIKKKKFYVFCDIVCVLSLDKKKKLIIIQNIIVCFFTFKIL